MLCSGYYCYFKAWEGSSEYVNRFGLCIIINLAIGLWQYMTFEVIMQFGKRLPTHLS